MKKHSILALISAMVLSVAATTTSTSTKTLTHLTMCLLTSTCQAFSKTCKASIGTSAHSAH